MDAIFFYLSFGAVALFYGYWLFILHFRPGYSQKPAKDKSLASFRWEDTNPQKLRPFKPIYHITMGLQSQPPSELILIDSKYKERVLDRQKIMEDHPAIVMGAVPEGHIAVKELYTFLVQDYLPTRYPTMFVLSREKDTMANCVTGRVIPTQPPEDPIQSFRFLGETVEDDLILLRETPDGHQMVAFVCCYPAGFDPSAKLGKLLKDIHEPVPSYEKIGPSMEKFFGKLEVGKSVKRMNWSINTLPTLFTPQGMHIYEDDQAKEDEDIDIKTAGLRVELQTLTRLPKTRAILFSFKTYRYPLEEVKAEGLGPQLADAIEGLKKGNAPGMWKYKGAYRWGKASCDYLRS